MSKVNTHLARFLGGQVLHQVYDDHTILVHNGITLEEIPLISVAEIRGTPHPIYVSFSGKSRPTDRVSTFCVLSGWYTISHLRALNLSLLSSDQCQISPAASPAILHDTVWRTWLLIAYSDGKCFCHQILTTALIHLSLKGWENALFELGSDRVKQGHPQRFSTLLFSSPSTR